MSKVGSELPTRHQRPPRRGGQGPFYIVFICVSALRPLYLYDALGSDKGVPIERTRYTKAPKWSQKWTLNLHLAASVSVSVSVPLWSHFRTSMPTRTNVDALGPALELLAKANSDKKRSY